MKNIIGLLTILIFISGCGKIITVPIDSTPLVKDKSTLIIYTSKNDSKSCSACINTVFPSKLSIDNHFVGQITPEEPLKIAIEPGKHDLYVESESGDYNQVLSHRFERNEVYLLRAWLEIRVQPKEILVKLEESDKIDSYQVRSHK